jgi:hypothetical protein
MGSVSSGDSKSRSSGSSQTTVWNRQAPYLQNLYQQAAQQYSRAMSQNIGGQSAGLVGNLFGGAGPYAQAGTNPAIANLMQRSQAGNPYIEQQVAGLGQDLGNFYRQQLLPGIASQAGLAGQPGGTRQGIASGLAGQGIAQQFASQAANLRGGAYALGNQAALGAGNLAQASVANLPNLYNLGMAPFMAQWLPLQQYAGLIGDPTLVSRSRNRSWSQTHTGSFSFGGGGG